MHRFFSSAGLWPTLVSVLALFVHPLLFHLFSIHHHLLLLLLLLPLLFLLLPVDSRLSIHLFLRWEDFWDCVYTHTSPVLPVFLFPFFTPVSLSVSAPFHLPLLITLPPPLTPPFLASSQRVSTCLSSSRSLAPSKAEMFFLQILKQKSAVTLQICFSIASIQTIQGLCYNE